MSSLPEVLYHYTTQAGLLGILQSDSLWATKIHYLNDASEYQLALSLASEILQGLLKGERNTKKRRKVQCLLENLHTIEHLNVCVGSLSAQRDLLSQWRAYASQPGSYALGFHSNQIRDVTSTQDFELVECVYDAAEQRRLVEELVLKSLSVDFNTVPSRIDSSRPRTAVALRTGGDFAFNFARLAPIIKGHAFHQEAEWRLISTKGVDVRRMSFRPGQSMLTPYIPICLGTEKTYLESVTVGPTPHEQLARLSTQSLLAHWNIAQLIQVHLSEASYRNW